MIPKIQSLLYWCVLNRRAIQESSPSASSLFVHSQQSIRLLNAENVGSAIEKIENRRLLRHSSSSQSRSAAIRGPVSERTQRQFHVHNVSRWVGRPIWSDLVFSQVAGFSVLRPVHKPIALFLSIQTDRLSIHLHTSPGNAPYYLIKPVLEKCNPDQLFRLEDYNPVSGCLCCASRKSFLQLSCQGGNFATDYD